MFWVDLLEEEGLEGALNVKREERGERHFEGRYFPNFRSGLLIAVWKNPL